MDGREVVRGDQRREVVRGRGRVSAEQDRIERRAIPHGVEPFRGAAIFLAIGGWTRRLQRQDRADAQIVMLRPQRRDRHAMRQVLVMHGLEHIGQAFQPGRVLADPMAEQGMNVGLVEGRPMLDPVAEALGDDASVVGEFRRCIAVEPAVFILQAPAASPNDRGKATA